MYNVVREIRNIVKKFFEKDWSSKDFLTEDDVRCHLFRMLQDALIKGKNNNLSLHAEVRWYGESNNNEKPRLRYRSDIVILNSESLKIEGSSLKLPSKKLPSKGYVFNKYYAIIEIKLRRINDTSSERKFLEAIKKEIERLKEIKDRTDDGCTSKCYILLIFDKKKKRKALLDLVGWEYYIKRSNLHIDWKSWNL